MVCEKHWWILDSISNKIVGHYCQSKSTRQGFWCYPESFSKSYQHKLERQPIYFWVKLGWYRQRQMYTISKRTLLYTIECPGSNHDFTMPIKLHCQNTVCQKWNWQNSICQNSNWQNSICRKCSMPKFQLPKCLTAGASLLQHHLNHGEDCGNWFHKRLKLTWRLLCYYWI